MGWRAASSRRCVAHRTVTVGVTEIPKREAVVVVEATVDDDLDGHAAHNLHKVAGGISAGKAEKRAPLPCWMLSTWPRNRRLG